MGTRLLAALAAAAALLLSGCGDSRTGPEGHHWGPLATVEWEGGRPALYLQNADGSDRFRVHFEGVRDDIPGNWPDMEVTDQSVFDISGPAWSPDGRHLAVIVSVAFDASQVVVVSRDGQTIRAASMNQQYVWNTVEWAPDSRRIAYIMSTHVAGALSDLFITDLRDPAHPAISRITTGGIRSGYDAFRFAASGRSLYITRHLGWADDSINVRCRLTRINLASGVASEAPEEITGIPAGITRDGRWGLFIRLATLNGPSMLVRRSFASGVEVALLTGDVGRARLLQNDREAVVRVGLDGDPHHFGFHVMWLEAPERIHSTLPTRPTTISAALAPPH